MPLEAHSVGEHTGLKHDISELVVAVDKGDLKMAQVLSNSIHKQLVQLNK